MKIAVPIFGERISPRFDCAPTLRVVELMDSRRKPSKDYEMMAWPPEERPAKVAELGVDVLICGGIDRLSLERCQELDVAVTPWVSGAAADALSGYLNGQVSPGAMLGRGGRCRGQWRFGCGRGQGRGFGGGKGNGPVQ